MRAIQAPHLRKDTAMSTFIQSSYRTQHVGATRIEPATTAAGALYRGIDSTKSLSAMLLAFMVSALLVVADQLIGAWADGHIMLAWMAMWLVCFASLALFAGSARKVAVLLVGSLDAWSVRVARSRADARLWVIAKSDPRVMADLNAAMMRNER
jgi:hypothetical protein